MIVVVETVLGGPGGFAANCITSQHSASAPGVILHLLVDAAQVIDSWTSFMCSRDIEPSEGGCRHEPMPMCMRNGVLLGTLMVCCVQYKRDTGRHLIAYLTLEVVFMRVMMWVDEVATRITVLQHIETSLKK